MQPELYKCPIASNTQALANRQTHLLVLFFEDRFSPALYEIGAQEVAKLLKIHASYEWRMALKEAL